jgi:hypothetical protein
MALILNRASVSRVSDEWSPDVSARLGTKGALRCWVRGVMDLVKDANATGLHSARDNHRGG